MHAGITGTLLIALVATTAVNAVGCPATLDVNANGGKAWLGMSAGGVLAGGGEGFPQAGGGGLFTASLPLVPDGVHGRRRAPPGGRPVVGRWRQRRDRGRGVALGRRRPDLGAHEADDRADGRLGSG